MPCRCSERTCRYVPPDLPRPHSLRIMDDDAQIGDFVERTGVSRERARYYLQAAGGNIAEALSAFFEEQDDEEAVLAKKVAARSPS